MDLPSLLKNPARMNVAYLPSKDGPVQQLYIDYPLSVAQHLSGYCRGKDLFNAPAPANAQYRPGNPTLTGKPHIRVVGKDIELVRTVFDWMVAYCSDQSAKPKLAPGNLYRALELKKMALDFDVPLLVDALKPIIKGRAQYKLSLDDISKNLTSFKDDAEAVELVVDNVASYLLQNPGLKTFPQLVQIKKDHPAFATKLDKAVGDGEQKRKDEDEKAKNWQAQRLTWAAQDAAFKRDGRGGGFGGNGGRGAVNGGRR